MIANTLLLRIEGPLQAWGVQESKFVIRRTAEGPTKSGVIGMLCAALGVSRLDAAAEWLPRLTDLHKLRMGVRIDTPGVRWWDYHTVGAEMKMRTAEGKHKDGPILTRREYLCDASFLVALQGTPELIAELEEAMRNPKWTLYLGRKSCPPSRPLMEHPAGVFHDLRSALAAVPWRPRLKRDKAPETVDCLLDWEPSAEQPEAPDNVLVWYDVPLTFEPPSHRPRFVSREELSVGPDGKVGVAEKPAQNYTPGPLRVRTDYDKKTWGKIRDRRMDEDEHLCVFCKSPAATGQHISYRRAGREHNLEALADERIMREHIKEVRSLCRLCHDAVTMIEYGLGMGLDRINPEDPKWRDQIIQKRDEIIKFRSLETRRRQPAAEEVE